MNLSSLSGLSVPKIGQHQSHRDVLSVLFCCLVQATRSVMNHLFEQPRCVNGDARRSTTKMEHRIVFTLLIKAPSTTIAELRPPQMKVSNFLAEVLSIARHRRRDLPALRCLPCTSTSFSTRPADLELYLISAFSIFYYSQRNFKPTQLLLSKANPYR